MTAPQIQIACAKACKTPTKIKARKMYENRYKTHTSIHATKNDALVCRCYPHLGTHLVFVLDASRYGDCVTQMGSAIRHSIQRGDTEHQAAMCALRSIGITKGAK